nr:MAG TPA: hypothetical protein [Caudoviricetes sp.]
MLFLFMHNSKASQISKKIFRKKGIKYVRWK